MLRKICLLRARLPSHQPPRGLRNLPRQLTEKGCPLHAIDASMRASIAEHGMAAE